VVVACAFFHNVARKIVVLQKELVGMKIFVLPGNGQLIAEMGKRTARRYAIQTQTVIPRQIPVIKVRVHVHPTVAAVAMVVQHAMEQLALSALAIIVVIVRIAGMENVIVEKLFQLASMIAAIGVIQIQTVMITMCVQTIGVKVLLQAILFVTMMQ